MAALPQRLKGADKDGNGFLTPADVRTCLGQTAAKAKIPEAENRQRLTDSSRLAR